ncbi:MAG: hypothetical protein KAU94_08590 [Verrucomicrobia bacterium]|nr:hypothetical protein [Verrucomicrobiota bacterium]
MGATPSLFLAAMIPSATFRDNTYVFDAGEAQDGMIKSLSGGDGLFVIKTKKRLVAAKQLNRGAPGPLCGDPDEKHSLLIYFFGHNPLGLLNLRRTGDFRMRLHAFIFPPCDPLSCICDPRRIHI